MVRKRKSEDAKGDEAVGTAEERAPEGGAEAGSPEERIAELERRCEDLNARWLRAQADYKNLRRRSQTEFEAGVRGALQPLLEELLLVLDFLDLALSSEVESADAKNLAMGVQMTRTKFAQALEASDVLPIETTGAFDPNLHEAKETREDTDAEPGTIVATIRKGYTWQGRVLRPASVVVAAGPAGPVGDPGDEGEDGPEAR